MAASETDSGPAVSMAWLPPRVALWLSDRSDRSIAQRSAGAAFLVRVVGAGLVFVTQVLMARWMGRFEFGIYVSAWAWVSVLGPLAPLGFAYSAQRFIPEYRIRADEHGLRGFLAGSRWLCLGFGTVAGLLFAAAVTLLGGRVPDPAPFLLAALVLPIFTLGAAQDGIARSFDWIDLALVPLYVLQPAFILLIAVVLHLAGGPMTAVSMLATACATLWVVTLVQTVAMRHRLRGIVGSGPRRYEIAVWVKTALPIFLVDGFYLLLFYVDILVLQVLVPPQDVAIYFAATKTLALVHFVPFSVGAAVAHRFSEYHVAGERQKLAAFITDTVRWSFWPTVALGAVVALLGKPILMLFGPGFDSAYPVILVVMAGLVLRGAVGPADRLLNMTGHQPLCATVDAVAFATNLILCLVLIPRFGIYGAAVATASAVTVEAILLFVAVKVRLGLRALVFPARSR